VAFLIACALGLLPACASSRVARENDRLREENQSLRDDVEMLTAANAELAAKLSEATAARPDAPDASILAALPRVSSIEFDTLTGFFPGDREKPATSINVYLRPLDGRRRFTQAVGTLAVEALIVPAEVGVSEAPPRARLVRTLTPGELRDAYRSGLTGTHYEIALPLEATLTDRSATIHVRVEFADAVTGVTHKAEMLVKPTAQRTKASTEARK
jgi:hypothetical protein